MTTKLIAFDPGMNTGYCVMEWDDRKTHRIIAHGIIPYEQRHTGVLKVLSEHKNSDYLIIEQYKIFRGRADVHINQELWGPKVLSAIETINAVIFDNNWDIKLLQPSVKANLPIHPNYRGKFIAEHDKDAYRLICYYALMEVYPVGKSRV
jgi:hypothetical protein